MSEEYEEYEGSDTLTHEVDLEKIEASNIVNLVQEGNFLVGTTSTGVRFRQHIPPGKILDKLNDDYVLMDITM